MRPRDEVLRITATMTIACAAGAAILGAVYVGTERYSRAAELGAERAAIVELLGLPAGARVTEVRQSLERPAAGGAVVRYEARPLGEEGAAPRVLEFSLDGAPLPPVPPASGGGHAVSTPLGRLFVAREGDRAAGFVVEGTTRGYKNLIRFLVALTPTFEIAGVRVIQHEEDPGLGAEVATRLFDDQFAGRSADEIAALTVTRDPMPEDWRAALLALERVPPDPEHHAALLPRERGRPIYAVTGATISSRALTDGVRATVDHFRRRWALLASSLEPAAGDGGS